jgi:hypothetical protein
VSRRTLLGLSGASAGMALVAVSAAPAAQAADPGPGVDCVDSTGHVFSTGTVYEDSLYDCVPLYGVGKVEFDVNSTDVLPADYNLTDDATTDSVAANTGAALTYFGGTGEPAGFLNLTRDTTAPNTHGYNGEMFFAVDSVENLDSGVPVVPPVSCTPGAETYSLAYRITYLPASVDFTSTVDDVEYEVTVTSAPAPLELYLNATAGVLDVGAPQCATNGASTLVAQTDADGEFDVVTQTHGTRLSPFPLAFVIGPIPPIILEEVGVPTPADLGDFDTAETELEPAAGPELAETGSKPSLGSLGLAGALIAAGAGAVVWSNRRPRGAHAAR